MILLDQTSLLEIFFTTKSMELSYNQVKTCSSHLSCITCPFLELVDLTIHDNNQHCIDIVKYINSFFNKIFIQYCRDQPYNTIDQ